MDDELDRLFKRLTPTMRRYLEARAEGWSCEDIAGEYGVTTNTVKNRLSHAYDRLGLDPTPGRGARAMYLMGRHEAHQAAKEGT